MTLSLHMLMPKPRHLPPKNLTLCCVLMGPLALQTLPTGPATIIATVTVTVTVQVAPTCCPHLQLCPSAGGGVEAVQVVHGAFAHGQARPAHVGAGRAAAAIHPSERWCTNDRCVYGWQQCVRAVEATARHARRPLVDLVGRSWPRDEETRTHTCQTLRQRGCGGGVQAGKRCAVHAPALSLSLTSTEPRNAGQGDA